MKNDRESLAIKCSQEYELFKTAIKKLGYEEHAFGLLAMTNKKKFSDQIKKSSLTVDEKSSITDRMEYLYS